MDATEVRKLDGYLKRLFGNARIRVVPRPQRSDLAEVFIGEEIVGQMTSDHEEGELSYNLRMEIEPEGASQPDFKPVPQLTAYLRRKFDSEKIRVVTRAKKTDSLEAYIGEEFLGVLFVEKERGRTSYILELPILDVDLEDV